ncbi:hypothetical protein L6164_000488 [Bauhinia variegata]|uniref:Uncharacterized protein n=1 Tax=Bauhinia variegata TaxID=167791 RepID=A0ACB9Q6T1_BAUVA|nr:hypothetical protein L6164_000488 [Bauhinia variegata]
MERKKTLTMNWAGLGDVDDDDDCFFETCERISSAVPQDLGSSSDEEDNFQDTRVSFSTCPSSVKTFKANTFRAISVSKTGAAAVATAVVRPDYNVWMSAPGSIRERRKRLLHGMGLDENKESLKITSLELGRAITRKFENANANAKPNSNSNSNANASASASASANANDNANANAIVNSNANSSSSSSSSLVPAKTMKKILSSVSEEQSSDPSRSPVTFVMGRSRSDGDIDSSFVMTRKEEFLGKISKQRLTRTSTEIFASRAAKIVAPYHDGSRVTSKDSGVAEQSERRRGKFASSNSIARVGAFFLIKNLDTGKEFIVNEYREDGMWNKVSDLQTGKQLTIEEFEKTVGHSPVVKELMRRDHGKKGNYISKSLKLSKKRGAAVLKSIKGVASGYFGETQREREAGGAAPQPAAPPPGLPLPPEKKEANNDWVRVRQAGKSSKDLTALHLSQEIQAHEGCIWTIKFSSDGHYLASAGEDKVIHVWEVQECEVMSLKPEDGSHAPIHPSLLASADRNGQAETPPLGADKKKKGKSTAGTKKGNPIPDYVHVPETVFSLSEKPFCSFEGHQDDVLDLSWSKSQQLLSSSMDKTVRLWDLESKACLKLFAHNDYVTCIQFNPVDDNYFISGSLDAKIRIWNVPNRNVVDWLDAHEMVTAISYTPDAQAAFVGTHKGTCRTYSTEDCKLCQTNTIELRHKKKANLRKVTGFQFAPDTPSQVLITSADSRVRIVEDAEVIQKFTGFRNPDSQIAASFNADGRYVICASEDSQVYLWKREKPKPAAPGKPKTLVVSQIHEHFPCKDVSVAIIWPCTIKGGPPAPGSKKQQQQQPSNDDSAAQGNSKKAALPPLPKKNANPPPETASATPEEDPAAISRTDSGKGDSMGSDSGSVRHGDSPSSAGDDSPSISPAANPSSSSADNGQATTAWGLVIVTAGFGGEIRCYQNFGLPRKVSR